MPQFPSTDWMRAFCVRLQEHPHAGEVAAALHGVYRFVVEPAGPVTRRHVFDVEIRPTGDGTARVTLLDEPAVQPTLEIAADYRRWRQLIREELDIGLAVMLRRVRVSGEVARVLAQSSAVGPLFEALHAVDTQWPDS